MKHTLLLILSLMLLVSSCKTVGIQQQQYTTTVQNIKLSTVGEQEGFIIKNNFCPTALPLYQDPIKVKTHLVSFNKPSYKAFVNAKTYQAQQIAVHYVDSLTDKPKFLKLEIADRVGVLNALNGNDNTAVFQFLKDKNKAHIVSSISIVFNESDMVSLMLADEVFLEMAGVKNYVLATYKDGQRQNILFNQGVVFAYQTSSFCWKETEKHQLQIVDLVKGQNKCSKGTYKVSKRAKQKINYYKF